MRHHLSAAPLCALCLFCCHPAAAQTWKKIFAKPSPFTTCADLNPLGHGRIIYVPKTDGNGLHPCYCARSDDGGVTWALYQIASTHMGEIHQIFCLESDTSVVFALGDSVFRSTNGGMTWSSVLPIPTGDGDNITYHIPSHTLYFMRSDSLSLWTSEDEGAHWLERTTNAPPAMVCTIAVSSAADPTILAGASFGKVMRSGNRGSTWQEVLPADGITETSKLIYVKSSPGTILTTSWKSKHRTVMLSTDDGQSWSDLHLDTLWVWALEVDPDPLRVTNGRPQHFWVGLLSDGAHLKYDVGETTDGGVTWKYWDLKDNSLGVWVLKYDPASGTLIAATSTGLYLLQTTAEVATRNEATTGLQLHLDPYSATVSWNMAVRAGELRVRDLLGRTVFHRPVEGIGSQQFDNSTFNRGMYFVELRESNGMIGTAKWMR